MKRPTMVLYITICCVAFVISKIVISCLLYKKWARKRRIIENSLSDKTEQTDITCNRWEDGNVSFHHDAISLC
ncbi:hypothetical protein ACMD2_25052 [Ananas comosus]|uniref:Uncharacterized protein n=1 Tax=Ananas comosus TaxID=4615 RepID=A0A199UZB9_ANACO|nr:hypothetical protein ACMD2_25052 [Ananas comosus]